MTRFEELEVLEKVGVTIATEYKGRAVDPDFDHVVPRERNVWEVVISKGEEQMSFLYWEFANVGDVEAPSEFFVLEYVQRYYPGTFEEYVYHEGLGNYISTEEDASKIRRFYNEKVRQYEEICRLFTEDGLYDLEEDLGLC